MNLRSNVVGGVEGVSCWHARRLLALGMILMCTGWSTGGRPAFGQSCSDPADCPAPTTSGSPVTIDCDQLDTHSFIAGQRVEVRPQANCTIMSSIDINVSNVIVHGIGTVTIRPAAASTLAAFRVQTGQVLIENFNLEANGGTRFFTGIVLNGGVNDVSIQNVTIGTNTTTGATSTAGMKFKSSGRNICVRNTTVWNAGPGDNNGYYIETDGGDGSIEFRLANAYANTEDGFALQNPSNLTSAKFLRCESTGNDGDGFDVNGGQIEILCSKASANNNSDPTKQGRGVVVSNAASQLHIENTHVADNEGNGINGGTTDLRVISSTVVDNDATVMGEQIVGSSVSVFTTVGQGRNFVYGGGVPVCGVSPVWGGNLCRSTAGATCCAGTNPCCAEAAVVFDGSGRTYLAVGSPGLDSSNGNPASFTGLVRIAHNQDYFGASRPQDGDNSGSSLRDVGAFERTPPPPAATPTRTPYPSFTKTPRNTDTPTRTRTTRPSRTPLPPTPTPPACNFAACPTPCVGDCDCDALVKVNELVFGVNHVMGRISSCVGCFDRDGNGKVTVNEIVFAVNRAIGGCSGGGNGGGGQGEGLTVTIDVGAASGLPGDSVSVPISISGGWGFVAGVQVDVLYDATAIDPYFDCVVSSRLQGGQSVAVDVVSVPPPPAGMRRLRVALLPSFSSIASFTDGEVAVCTFDLSGSAAPASYPIQVEEQGISDAGGNPFTAVANPGSITVCGGCGCP